MSETTVGIFVDYESPLARRVAGDIWSGLARASLRTGRAKTTAIWESLGEKEEPEKIEGRSVYVFVVGQDRPEAVENVGAVVKPDNGPLYGVVVAVPDRPSPLAGSLLYQGVERLTGSGVKAGTIEPALLHAIPQECESYAGRLLERLGKISG